jgi:hypothetical protein
MKNLTQEEMFHLNKKDIGDGIRTMMKVKHFDISMTQDALAQFSEIKPYQLSKIVNAVDGYSPDLYTVSKIISGGFDMTLRQFFLFLEELERKED